VYGEGGVDLAHKLRIGGIRRMLTDGVKMFARLGQRRHKLGVLSAQFLDLPRSLAQ
jgi:hypothetical protein